MVANYRPFNTILTPESGDDAYNTSAKIATLIDGAGSGSFTKIWQKTVPAQQGMRWGFGSPAYQYNQGIITFASVPTAASNTNFEEGNLEFRLANAAGTQIVVQARLYSGMLHSASRSATQVAALALLNDRNQAPPFPEQGDFVYEDSRLEMWWEKVADAGATVASVAFRIPATFYSA